MLAVPVHGHGVGHVDLAAVHAVEHLERMHDRAAMQQVDLEPAARHLVDAGDVLLAISVKMSVAGHDVCIFSVAVCARDTCGIAIAAAPVHGRAGRNLRRVVVLVSDLLMGMSSSLVEAGLALARAAAVINRPADVGIPAISVVSAA